MNDHILIGKRLRAVFLECSGAAVKFICDDGEEVIARADGDCCSKTWIECIESPCHCLGSKVIGISDLLEMTRSDCGKSEQGCLKFYGCRVDTEKGSFVVDYRNDSNGCYGGYLSWDDEDFYGGVSGQNGKIDKNSIWKEVE